MTTATWDMLSTVISFGIDQSANATYPSTYLGENAKLIKN
jgi:hypothetical protein